RGNCPLHLLKPAGSNSTTSLGRGGTRPCQLGTEASFDFGVGRAPGEAEGKYRAATGLVVGRNPAVVILDDSFANGKSQPGAVRLAVRGERLEQLAAYLGRNPQSGILHFRDQFRIAYSKAQRDFSAVGHRVCGVVNQVVENAPQALGVNQQI